MIVNESYEIVYCPECKAYNVYNPKEVNYTIPCIVCKKTIIIYDDCYDAFGRHRGKVVRDINGVLV